MKRFILLMILIGLSACSHPKEVAEPKYFFLFANPLKNHGVWQKAENGFLDACRDYHIDCESLGPTNIDTHRMNEIIETGLMMKVDGIITQGVVDEKLIKKAEELGIPFILVDSDQKDSERFAFIGKDFKYQAELLLKDIYKYYGNQSDLKIAIQVAELNFDIATKQIEEIEAIFKYYPGSFEIVKVSESKSDTVRAKLEWNKVFDEHPEINVAINFAGESAVPCFEAASEHHFDEVLIYGVDDITTTIEAIYQGQVDGSIVTSFYDYGYKSVEAIYQYLENGFYPNEMNPDITLVNKESLEHYEKHFK